MVRLPIETPISTLRSKPSDLSPALISGTDLFLYNPRKTVAGHVGIIKFVGWFSQLIVSSRDDR